ncbi:MAG: DUF1385 domain-containing protein [Candidatus Woesearchaeota archaeon]
MKSPNFVSVSVRKNNKEIKSRVKRFVSWTKKHKLLGIPFIRGMAVLAETMILGYKTLVQSANEAVGENEKKISAWELALTIIIALALFILIFKFIPFEVANLSKTENTFLFNAIEGVAKVVILILYLWLISFMKDVRVLFQYHGAEHKTIACYENKKELTVKNVRKCTKEHARCGTTFILFVMLVSILIYLIVPFKYNFWLKFLLRIALLPVIAGISYEILKLGGKKKTGIMKILSKPGLWLQNLTTREPNSRQIEVAIASLKSVLKKEGKI